MNKSVDFREILGSSYKFKEPLREKLQVNIDCVWKVLIMNCFLDINDSGWVFSEIIGTLAFFLEDFSQSNFYINDINQIKSNFFFNDIVKLSSLHLFSSRRHIMEMLKRFDHLVIRGSRPADQLNFFLQRFFGDHRVFGRNIADAKSFSDRNIFFQDVLTYRLNNLVSTHSVVDLLRSQRWL